MILQNLETICNPLLLIFFWDEISNLLINMENIYSGSIRNSIKRKKKINRIKELAVEKN